jgi:hypothetical protein
MSGAVHSRYLLPTKVQQEARVISGGALDPDKEVRVATRSSTGMAINRRSSLWITKSVPH